MFSRTVDAAPNGACLGEGRQIPSQHGTDPDPHRNSRAAEVAFWCAWADLLRSLTPDARQD